MTAVLDWSMDLLEPEEVDLFERLAVFSGGFSLDAVEAVAAPRVDDERRRPAGARRARRPVARAARAGSRRPAAVPAARAGAAVRDAAPARFGARPPRPPTGMPRTSTRARRHSAIPLQGPEPGRRARPARGRPRQPALGLPAAARARPRRGCRRARRQPLALPRAAWPRPRGAGVAGPDRARSVRRRALPGADRPARAAHADRRHRGDAARDRRGRGPGAAGSPTPR